MAVSPDKTGLRVKFLDASCTVVDTFSGKAEFTLHPGANPDPGRYPEDGSGDWLQEIYVSAEDGRLQAMLKAVPPQGDPGGRATSACSKSCKIIIDRPEGGRQCTVIPEKHVLALGLRRPWKNEDQNGSSVITNELLVFDGPMNEDHPLWEEWCKNTPFIRALVKSIP